MALRRYQTLQCLSALPGGSPCTCLASRVHAKHHKFIVSWTPIYVSMSKISANGSITHYVISFVINDVHICARHLLQDVAVRQNILDQRWPPTWTLYKYKKSCCWDRLSNDNRVYDLDITDMQVRNFNNIPTYTIGRNSIIVSEDEAIRNRIYNSLMWNTNLRI